VIASSTARPSATPLRARPRVPGPVRACRPPLQPLAWQRAGHLLDRRYRRLDQRPQANPRRQRRSGPWRLVLLPGRGGRRQHGKAHALRPDPMARTVGKACDDRRGRPRHG
jgi:hypothetical protein